jgi:hypothetical protein
MSEVQAVAAEAAPAPVTIVEPSKPTIEDTMAQVYEKNYPDSRVNRASDTGQFKSKEAAPVEEAAPAEGAEQVSDTAKQVTDKEAVAAPEETAPPSIPRPQSLSSDVDKLWNELPPEAQKLWAKRESEAHKQITELGQIAKATEPVRPALEQLGKVAQARGVRPEEAIQRFLEADAFLTRDPAAAIQWLAQSYRVDLSRLAPQQASSDTPESAQISSLHQEIAALKQQLYGVVNQITSSEQAEMQAREKTLTESVEKFAEGKDYWSDIEPEVLHQIHALTMADPARAQSSPLDVLKEAHDRAIKLTPSVAEKLGKAAKAEAEKKAKEEAAKKAAEAKKLASLNVRSTAGSSPKSQFKSFEDEMANVYDRIHSG